jgi:hypothetical protein
VLIVPGVLKNVTNYAAFNNAKRSAAETNRIKSTMKRLHRTPEFEHAEAAAFHRTTPKQRRGDREKEKNANVDFAPYITKGGALYQSSRLRHSKEDATKEYVRGAMTPSG